MSTKTKRAMCAVGAVIVAMAIAIGGTFAYTLFEHKSNFLKKDAKYLAKLVENFENKEDWEVGTTVTKEISVKNMGNTAQFPKKGWGNIYVRVQLKEFMEIKTVNYEYYYEGYEAGTTVQGDKQYLYFLIDRSGNFVRIPVEAGVTKEDAVAMFLGNPANWTDVVDDPSTFTSILGPDDFVEVQGLYDEAPYYYIRTREGFPNGQYGSGIVMEKIVGDAIPVEGMNGVTKATDVNYSDYYSTTAWHEENEECAYPAHLWDEGDPQFCDFGTHTYVEWHMNPDNYVLYSEWDGEIVEKWILDPDTGWAYWGAPLPEFDPDNPDANATSTLLDSIELIKDPCGEFFYVIHVDMEVHDYNKMMEQDDWLIKDAFKTAAKLSFKQSKVTKDLKDGGQGTPYSSPEIRNIDDEDVLQWTSSNPGVATVNSDGIVTLQGLTGTTTITATVTDGPHKGQSFSYTLEVVDTTEEPDYDIPVRDDDPFEPIMRPGADATETALNSDYMYMGGSYLNGFHFVDEDAYGVHYGFFRLNQIITDGNYDNVEIVWDSLADLNGGSTKGLTPSNFYIGYDTRVIPGVNQNDPVIVYKRVPPTYTSWDANLWEPLGPEDMADNVVIIPLSREANGVTQTAEITVHFTYTDCLFTAD